MFVVCIFRLCGAVRHVVTILFRSSYYLKDFDVLTFIHIEMNNYLKINNFCVKSGILLCLPPEFLPLSGLLTRWCASTLGTALLCSSRAGSFLYHKLSLTHCSIISNTYIFKNIFKPSYPLLFALSKSDTFHTVNHCRKTSKMRDK